ncbi:molybdopterin molybdotransferase MoeA [Streptomyces chiangmaiensis]|uniref:Molybdopterin molybdenumtransferase n=1 Tax=Streptomyces chiangmaiensis TaxID=766497 RepID=A0ABU7F9K6_9ACTN|nr:molybdopterin molybdotransferase MoeA [Streptomyces chiangmaiensis]MED7820877.1 molybdopterin molybdotransferase MoeA [Streptomyces chiangmaiensis]
MTGRGAQGHLDTEERHVEEALAVANESGGRGRPQEARPAPPSEERGDPDLDEALALVRDPDPHAPGPASPLAGPGAGAPASAPRPTGHDEAHEPVVDRAAGNRSPAAGASKHGARHTATPWPEARAVAERAARSVPRREPVRVPLDTALGLVLAAPLTALTDLPSFDTSAMDGWGVAGPGPWDVRDEGILAGHAEHAPLGDGEAVRIATGARVPPGTTAVLRSEHGHTDDKGRLQATPQASGSARAGGTSTLAHGQDIRPRGQECHSGDQLLPPGTQVTPAVLGLAAAAGYDTLTVQPRPRAEVLVLGDELLSEGVPKDGLIRDALGPMLPPWLRALGVDVVAVRRLGDDAEALFQAVTSSRADLIVTTGGTASGPVDHVHPTLRRVGAELLVDGVKVRPGHPMLLAHMREDQHLVGLPGNPLAAVSGLLTLAEPLLRILGGRMEPEPCTLALSDVVHGHPYDTRLVPVAVRADHAVPLHYNGPAMLRGIAAADALAVVPPGGARRGVELELLDLPWPWVG